MDRKLRLTIWATKSVVHAERSEASFPPLKAQPCHCELVFECSEKPVESTLYLKKHSTALSLWASLRV